MSNVSKRKKEGARTKIKTMGDHKEFLKRISKTLYYGQLPALPCLSLPVTEISCAAWSVAQRGRSLRRLHADAAAGIARQACVSPCALVLAILYLERLKRCNPDYLAAAAPADLFLVSLMVSNKFLQDDGEDDEVVCAEWAASGGLGLAHLKKLEIEFLNAIEWNVFVSDKSFEAGLEWLEREVALKQARLHGFFTYTDLTAVGGGVALRAVAGACARAALAYLAGLAALLASALVLAHVALPHQAPASAPAPNATDHPLSADTGLISPEHRSLHHHYASNDTPVTDALTADATLAGIDCCERWSRYHHSGEAKKNWDDSVIVFDWKSFEPWWSHSAVLNWLYQSSLISPVQRWLEKMTEYGELLKRELRLPSSEPLAQCDGRRQYARPWLQLGKLGVLVASVSDR